MPTTEEKIAALEALDQPATWCTSTVQNFTALKAEKFSEAMEVIRELRAENERQRSAIALAFGYLWHVNNEPLAPIPTYSPELAAIAVRKVLRDLLTHEQRGIAINQVQALLAIANY